MKSTPKTILITGGTGMIGTRLTELLLKKGYQVSYLSRHHENVPNVKVYQWDISKKYIEEGALENADYIVHLAGTGIADKRWTEKRKREIIDSRIKPITLIINQLQEKKLRSKAFISSSAIGYYGGDTGDEKLTENSKPGNDFLAKCTVLWEKTADEVQEKLGIRTVKIRTGIVVSERGGALPKLISPIKWGLGATFGSGKQWMSWIHLDDLCRIFIKAIEEEKMTGAYNAVASKPITNEALTKIAAKVLKKSLWLPNIPKFLLKLALGEMAVVVIGSEYVVNERIKNETNFQYNFQEIEEALEEFKR